MSVGLGFPGFAEEEILYQYSACVLLRDNLAYLRDLKPLICSLFDFLYSACQQII